ncbi:retrovirus-related Pol polyprotein from type-2 retrotransposable element R2DM [Nephila pilipes]|uniref:Retrovirus-related Pol polyprotein from type-2 retrotransposable element R2DM n=1 Tax=Nephila pilipes TaxID=299642 RepID=A0A8X6QYZ1_NEPPI|nr:retrovirus-related Pol polyprotein from type-2 retrotransposable element R2DM [Nephila pilipes]
MQHNVLFAALKAKGVDGDFIAMVRELYIDASTSILTASGLTNPIPILRGIKQGSPLSGILFNMAIDHNLHLVQGPNDECKILVFVDDASCSPSRLRKCKAILTLSIVSLGRLDYR